MATNGRKHSWIVHKCSRNAQIKILKNDPKTQYNAHKIKRKLKDVRPLGT